MKKFPVEIVIILLIILVGTFIFFQYLSPRGTFKRVAKSVEMAVKTRQSKDDGYYLSKFPSKKVDKILVELSQGEMHSLVLLAPDDLSQKKIFEIKSKTFLNPSVTHNGVFIAIGTSQISFIDTYGKGLDYISKYQRPFTLNNCVFSPNGEFLAYEFSLPNQTYPEIFVESDLKYFENAIITRECIRIPNPEKAANHSPQFLPSGEAIAFLADFSGSPDICIFDLGLQTPALIRLTNGAQPKSVEKNIFAVDVKEEFLFYVQNTFWEGGEKICAVAIIPSGKPVKTGTISMTRFGQINYVEYNQTPTAISRLYTKIAQIFVSPDGKDIIFAADGQIITMKLNGTKVVKLANGDFAQFSPDGKQVAIGLNQGNKSSLSLMNFEVRRQGRKTELDGQIESLIWF